MINVRELRLGNYIYFDGAIHEILGVQKLSIWTKWHNDADGEPKYFKDLESYDPIPLTPEFLEVCEFKRDGAYWSHECLNLSTEVARNGREILMSPNRKYCSEIKFLHHLQNLFYDLTYTELKIDFNSYGVNKI